MKSFGGGGDNYRSAGGYGAGSTNSKRKANDDDDFDIVDNILDEMTEAKGLDPLDHPGRPRTTAASGGGFGNKRESLWSAAGPNNGRPSNVVGTGSKYGAGDDLDDLIDEGDDLGSGLKLSAGNQASSH